MFSSVEQLISEIYLPESYPSMYDRWVAVKQQAIRHTRTDSPGSLLEAIRPNESELIRTYRLQNYRAITHEGIIKYNDKLARIIQGANYTIAKASEELRLYLENTDFPTGNGDSLPFDQFFSRVVMPYDFEDPNGVLLAFPYNKDNPDVPPANLLEDGGLPANMPVSIKAKVVSSESIRYIDEDYFAWDAGGWSFVEKGQEYVKPFFFIIDKSNYYRLIPVGWEQDKNKRRRVKYELQLWYFHDTGFEGNRELPINILGGTLQKVRGKYGTFNESFLKPYFEYGDEVITTFSDYQAVKVRTSYPIRALKKQPCGTCSGHGRVIEKTEHGDNMIKCGTCSGTGVIADLSPFKDLILEDDDKSTQPPLQYIAPPIDALEFLNRSWMDLLQKAKRAINLDLLEDVTESGEAKKTRLQDLHDTLMKIAGNVWDVMERHLWFTECLLNPTRASRVVPVIIRPVSLQIKDEEILADEVNTAHPADAVASLMEYYRKKYAGDEVKIRLKELALMYSPLLAVTNPQELQIRLLGAYTNDDIVKRDRAEWAMEQVYKAGRLDIFDSDLFAIFQAADELIKPFLPEPQTNIFE